MSWSKINFFYEHKLDAGVPLVATSTASGYDVANLIDMLEGTFWKATGSGTQYITFDYGTGNFTDVDYLAIGAGHNLADIGAEIDLEYSNDNFSSDINQFGTSFAPTTNKSLAKVYTSQNTRYSRLKLFNMSAAPQMSLAIWGESTELDFASVSYDPHRQNAKTKVSVTQGGYVAGIHTQYIERRMTIKIKDADAALYAKVDAWWEDSGRKNFFVAPEITESPNDVYLMRPDMAYNNPLVRGGLYRDIAINLTGRKG